MKTAVLAYSGGLDILVTVKSAVDVVHALMLRLMSICGRGVLCLSAVAGLGRVKMQARLDEVCWRIYGITGKTMIEVGEVQSRDSYLNSSLDIPELYAIGV
ncbi:MAG: hypothetical protein C5S49_00740 [Candidatus Methanogaster sp.]|nr:MAG: hypothetical protein C5S49_00740 [ANME-2 cluster archaeon]